MSSILLIQSDPAAARRMVTALSADSTLAVCACAGTLAEARQALARRTPDLLIGELRLPDGLLAELLRELRPERSHVLVTAASLHDPQLMHTLRAGADAFIPASCEPDALLDAARTVLAGGSPVVAAIARHMLASSDVPSTRPVPGPEGAPAGASALTPADRNLLEWASEGYGVEEIARAVKITPQQVGMRMRAVFRRLHAAAPRP